MSSTDTIVCREIDRNAAKIQRAIERGGLPTEAEAVAFWRALTDVQEQLESLTWRIEGIATSDTGDDLPFEVSLEQLGVVAMLVSDVENELATLTSLNERSRTAMSSLLAIRAEQQSGRHKNA